MRKLLFLLFVIFFLHPTYCVGTADYSKKPIQLQAGKYEIQELFEMISKQASCVFSFNPQIINASQKIKVDKLYTGSVSAALKKFLPANIQFKFVNKYIVLLKAPEPSVAIQTQKLPAPLEVKDTILQLNVVSDSNTDSLVVPVRIPEPVVEIVSEPDSRFFIAPDTIRLPLVIAPTDTVQTSVLPIANRLRFANIGLVEFELSQDFTQFSTTMHAGISQLYAILSLGIGAEKVRSRGLGLGTGIKLGKSFGVNIEFIKKRIISGQTFDLGVKNDISHFRLEINLDVSSNFKFFAGPTFSILNSKYFISDTSYDLGSSFSYGAIAGFKLNLFPLFVKKTKS